ncbi:MAG: MOSC N-terminal beta barrel domain-containing protein [Ferruginibacter sp.]
MEPKPCINKISVYPVKSLDGISLQKAQIGIGGCLLHDREYAIKDSNGKYVNGKKNPLVHLLRMNIDFTNQTISFKHESETRWYQFSLLDQTEDIDEYLSSFFGMPVKLHKNTEGRFLDVPDKSGMTILSTSSLKTVSDWFNGMEITELRKRFRATLEINNVPAFWEDRLFFEQETAVEFTIGDVLIMGLSPRARCVVPSRHPQTGDVVQGFQKSFANYRAASLPAWSSLENYSHSYYLSVDCYLPPSEVGKWIYTGDEVKITGNKSFPTFTSI